MIFSILFSSVVFGELVSFGVSVRGCKTDKASIPTGFTRGYSYPIAENVF